MKRILPLVLVFCLLLGGCSIFDGSYTYVNPHPVEGDQPNPENVTASDYQGLCAALAAMIESGVENGVISVSGYDPYMLEGDWKQAVEHTQTSNPIAAWAVDGITWDLGTSGGQSAVAVEISYIHDRAEIQQIRKTANSEEAAGLITKALDDCGTGLVLLVDDLQETDFAQLVEDHADLSPQTVMETPEVVVNIYPQEGPKRLVELKFSYKTSRDTLRSMQKQVRTIFDSSTMFVGSYSMEREKFEGLYAFLMDFLTENGQPLKTSITPAYSLLRHGVGNEKAFATVYAAMCREAGLTCQVISGTRDGESWYWNLICIDGVYSHLDLLRCSQAGAFQTYTDDQMEAYYWDYDLVPATT